MHKTKAIIVDDAPNARKLLRLMLAEIAPQIQVVAEAENAAKALQIIEQEQPQIVFLDIEMPGKSGLQLIADSIGQNLNFKVIFTTAYNQYAIQAFRLNAIDYLLKPINEEHLQEAVNKAIAQISLSDENAKLSQFIDHYRNNSLTITIAQGNTHIFVKVEEVMYIRADGSYTHLHTVDGTSYTVSKNLKHYESALCHSPNFVRVHRKYLINTQHIKQLDKQNRGTVVTMLDNHTIDLARERRDAFFERLK